MASSGTLACPAQRHGDALVDTAVPQVPSWAVLLRRSCTKALPILRMAQEIYTRGSPSTDGEKGCRAQPPVCARRHGPLPGPCGSDSLVHNRCVAVHASQWGIYTCVTAVREEPLMAAVLCRTTLPVRTDPLEAAAPQMMAPWAEVLALLHHLEALAEAGAAFQLVETPGRWPASWPTPRRHR